VRRISIAPVTSPLASDNYEITARQVALRKTHTKMHIAARPSVVAQAAQKRRAECKKLATSLGARVDEQPRDGTPLINTARELIMPRDETMPSILYPRRNLLITGSGRWICLTRSATGVRESVRAALRRPRDAASGATDAAIKGRKPGVIRAEVPSRHRGRWEGGISTNVVIYDDGGARK